MKVIDLLARGLENNSQIDLISLDFARAFDVVPFQRLLLKLNYYGIRKLLPWFEDFLTGRTEKVLDLRTVKQSLPFEGDGNSF